MKKNPIVIALFTAGIVLICLSVVLAVVATAGKNVIGGADWPTFTYVFFYERRGLYSALAFGGVIAIVVPVVMGWREKKRS